MAESVRELVVTLSLEAGTFSKTCSDINSQIKGVEAEFKNITAGTDGWQTTLAGRNAKLAALTETLDLQKTKVATIATELEKAKQALNADPGNLGAARKVSSLETQLNNATTAAALTKAEIEKLNLINLTALGTKLTAFGTKLKTFGRKFSMYIGGPLAAMGVKSYNAALDYESAMVTMQKTVDETDATKYQDISNAFLLMSESGPVPYTELMELAGAAGALGVGADDIVQFVDSVSKLSVTADDLDAFTGADALAKLMNITEQGDYSNIENIASALTDLGNKTNATEGQILSMAQHMAATGELAGMSTVDILAMAAGFVSVGIEAEAGGSAAGKLMKQMQSAAEIGSKAIKEFSDTSMTAGMSVREIQLAADDGKWVTALAGEMGKTKEEVKGMVDAMVALEQFSGVMDITPAQFIAGWDASAGQSILDFFMGLNKIEAEQGEDTVLSKLDEMGLTEIRLSNLVASAATNPDLFKKALVISDEAYKNNIALSEEAEKRYATAESRQETQFNTMENAAADVGENVVDAVTPLIETVTRLVGEFGKLDEATQDNWVRVAGALILFGPAASGVGSVAKGIGDMVSWMVKVKPETLTAFSGMGKGALFAPLAATAAIWAVIKLMELSAQTLADPIPNATENLKAASETFVPTGEEAKTAKGEMDGFIETYNKVRDAMFNPVNSTTDVAGQEALWESVLPQDVLDRLAGGMEVAQLVGPGGVISSVAMQYMKELEAKANDAAVLAGLAIPEGLNEGVGTGTQAAVDGATALAESVDAAVTTPLGIQSPSTVMRQHGLDIGLGLQLGILDGLPLAAAAMNVLGAALTAIASANGTAAGAAYGSAFSSAASIQVSAAMGSIKRELDQLNIRINRGYGNTGR